MSTVLERLRQYQDNRGMMANLRCILVASKKHRAWPVLHRLGIRIDDEVAAFVAGLFAAHPETAGDGNLGDTCRKIEHQRKEQAGDGGLTATERRFQHLLAASGRTEVFARVQRMVFMAKAHGVPVNYGVLQRDLSFWGDRVRADWAASFWAQTTESAGGVIV